MSNPSRRTFLFCLCIGVLALMGGTVVATEASLDTPATDAQISEPSPVIIDVNQSTNYLSPESETARREEYSTVDLDVSAAVESDALRLHGQHKQRVLSDRLEESDEVSQIQLRTVRSLERHAQDLEQQQRELYGAYSNETIDTETLYRELVRLGVTAGQYQGLTDTAQDSGGLSEERDIRYSNLEGEIPLLPTPLVSHLETELATGGETSLYVQGANESLVLAAVEGDRYLRQATLFSERDKEASEQFGIGDQSEADDAYARAEQLYPWTLEDAYRPELRGFGNSSVYRLQAAHSHGELQTFIDGATTNPFHEVQEKNPFSVPVSEFTQQTENDLRLDVQLTAPTGPMRIEVIDTGNLEYENITVKIDNKRVQTLSESDDFYTIQPVGSFEATAETDTGESVSVLVFPSSESG